MGVPEPDRRALEVLAEAAVQRRLQEGVTGGPHTLRHTFASQFLAKVPDLGLLAEILGHSEESVTRHYQHMLPERLARARNVVSIGMPGTNSPVPKSRRPIAAIS